jgi:hypothetical protein
MMMIALEFAAYAGIRNWERPVSISICVYKHLNRMHRLYSISPRLAS